MSVSALTVINEAALTGIDPEFSRITRPQWRTFLNQAARDLCRKMRLRRRRATFDIVALDEQYAVPADCIQIIRVEANLTPSDATTWYKLGEMFEDEHESATSRSYPSSSPLRYCMRTETFDLYPMPDAGLTAGGRVTYWGMPDEVTDEGTQNIPVLDVLRDSLRDRMVIHALRALEKFDKAAAYEAEWQAALTFDRDRIEDRSADRRSRMRPTSAVSRSYRQV